MSVPPELIERLRQAGHVVVFTGAGISAESGIPTFRQAQRGLWARYDPQELATPGAFRRRPELVWSWYAWRRQLAARAQPNPGHRALATMETRAPRFDLITQNVDNLHQQAGNARVIELHGNLRRSKCLDHEHPVPDWEQLPGAPPACPVCGSLVRPDVVWFGESLPATAVTAAIAASQSAEIFFSIGTSTLVEPAASLPFLAAAAGALTVEINPQATPFSSQADLVLRGPAGVILPQLMIAAWPG